MNSNTEKKLSKVVFVAISVLLILGIAALVLYSTGVLGKWFGWDSKRVLSMEETTVSLDADASVTTAVSKDLLLRANCSGLRASKADGETAWDISYQMTLPLLLVGGDYAAVADCGGTVAIVASQKGELYRVTTEKKIQTAALNQKGELVLVLEGDLENWVNVYGADGALMITRHTYQDRDGLVLSVALSDDTERLITSYYKYTGSARGSLLTVFDLSSKGASLVDRILGSITIANEMVMDLFFSGDLCFFVSESSFGAVYTRSDVKINWRHETGRKLEAVAFAGKTIALIYSESRVGLQTNGEPGISVYNTSGTRVFFEKSDVFCILSASNSSYIYGDGYFFTQIDERGVRAWTANLTVYNESMHSFSDDKTVAGRTKSVLQYYIAVNK